MCEKKCSAHRSHLLTGAVVVSGVVAVMGLLLWDPPMGLPSPKFLVVGLTMTTVFGAASGDRALGVMALAANVLGIGMLAIHIAYAMRFIG